MSQRFFTQTSQDIVYLDANATTPVLPRIADVVSHTMKVSFGNPSSSHITGVQAKYLLEQTRSKARRVIGAQTGDILFTSGATEGIQTAIVSTLLANRHKATEHSVLLYGATEHKAVPNTLKHWNDVLGLGAKVVAIPVDENGLLDHEFIAEHVPKALMICTMAVNNETGVYQDLSALERVIRQHNASVSWMVDCVQALGKQALALSDTSIDYAPFSGHKLYAPKGIGFLYIRENSPYTPFIAGGGQESGMRSGTENLPGIAGLYELFDLLLDEASDVFKPVETLHQYRKQLINALEQTFGSITFNMPLVGSVPTTLNFCVDSLTSKEVMDLFDAAGIRVSGGSACSSGANRSFVLDAMSASDWQSENAIRMSFGPAATQAEIDLACERICALKPVLANNCLIVSDAVQPEHEVCALGLTQLRHQGSCCWLYVAPNNDAVIIDPVVELVPRIERLVAQQQLHVKAVLETHKHQDKDSARALLANRLSLNTDSDELGWPGAAVQLGEQELVRIPTPGHSADSHTYLLRQGDNVSACFCGDLLIFSGLGSTQFADANVCDMAESIRSLAPQLSDDTVICPAHDYEQCFALTWAAQVQATPLLKQLLDEQIDKERFAEQKAQLDEQLSSECGALCGFSNVVKTTAAQQLSVEQVQQMLEECEQETIVLDVREPYEHGAKDIRSLFNVGDAQLVNVPLSRLANAFFAHQLSPQKRYVLICRTGNRSGQAINNLKSLGFDKVYNLQGGLALV
ncbi:aminotransferase class V-fold PLP-dependent enzyme [Pseudoalteromonas sp. SSDWG2]|uniref:aminotransferase class V-fold PLP-dependent enzyme n=1 Tax=Pseudoalteromonas sp. SSDWG2 TaxID=3139391 RepID=UPI003BAD4FB7